VKEYKVGKLKVKAQLWDTAGQERFRSMAAPYYRGTLFLYSGASAVLLCFSLADRASFDNLGHWLDEINKQSSDVQIYLVGCKSDLDIVVPTD
jgi:GTPase SAR1 family protein